MFLQRHAAGVSSEYNLSNFIAPTIILTLFLSWHVSSTNASSLDVLSSSFYGFFQAHVVKGCVHERMFSSGTWKWDGSALFKIVERPVN